MTTPPVNGTVYDGQNKKNWSKGTNAGEHDRPLEEGSVWQGSLVPTFCENYAYTKYEHL